MGEAGRPQMGGDQRGSPISELRTPISSLLEDRTADDARRPRMGRGVVRRGEAIREDLRSPNSDLRSPVFSATEPQITQGDADGGG